ncbi:MAG TPA: Uma2 family endonuclease [Planctomycetota bacterium]|nr:Uma2 family endonuclease [Planctomycetota bacterium]
MATKTLISCEEFEALALAEKVSPWAELIDGEIVEMAPGGWEHSYVSLNIATIIRDFVRANKLGHVGTNEAGIHIKSELPRSRGADVVFISYKRLPKGSRVKGFLRVPPELIVEVRSDKDTWAAVEEKVADYHRTGIDEVWVADPATRTVKKFFRNAEPVIVHDGSDLDGGAVLPGFKTPVARFFDEE